MWKIVAALSKKTQKWVCGSFYIKKSSVSMSLRGIICIWCINVGLGMSMLYFHSRCCCRFFQFGSDVYLCYKKSVTKRIIFTNKAGMFSRLFFRHFDYTFLRYFNMMEVYGKSDCKINWRVQYELINDWFQFVNKMFALHTWRILASIIYVPFCVV